MLICFQTSFKLLLFSQQLCGHIARIHLCNPTLQTQTNSRHCLLGPGIQYIHAGASPGLPPQAPQTHCLPITHRSTLSQVRVSLLASLQCGVSPVGCSELLFKWSHIHPQLYAFAFTVQGKINTWCPICYTDGSNHSYDCPKFILLHGHAKHESHQHSSCGLAYNTGFTMTT